jgi:hypothetical protein
MADAVGTAHDQDQGGLARPDPGGRARDFIEYVHGNGAPGRHDMLVGLMRHS